MSDGGTDDPRLPELPTGAFDRQDGGDDGEFYAPVRLVAHIDKAAVATLTARYSVLIPRGVRVLDLMSSWVSHLPADGRYAEVVGHGMNAEELAANPRLDRWFVQDLNRDPALPPDDATFGAALCCVGVQYLQRPLAVFDEVRRVLTPGAPFRRQLLQPLLPDQGRRDLACARFRWPRRAGEALPRARRVRRNRRRVPVR